MNKYMEKLILDDSNLKKAGLKITHPRRLILDMLEKAKERHVSAEDIYRLLLEAGEEIGLATVYRVLTQFEEAGLVIRHHFESGSSVFELNSGTHHDHLVCLKCSRVEEFIDSFIEKRQEEIAREADFTMTDHSLNIYGICRYCQEKE